MAAGHPAHSGAIVAAVTWRACIRCCPWSSPCTTRRTSSPSSSTGCAPSLDGLDATYEVLAVDDGSTDLTPAILQRLHREWQQLRVVRLRANAGHQAAISAGLQRARGDFVVTIDADLQDPPEVIAQMLAKARGEGVDVVYGVRSDRSTDSWFKRFDRPDLLHDDPHHLRHRGISDAGDFRLMSRATVDAINDLPEHNRVLRFIVPALGFPSDVVEYRRDERAAGASKYPLVKMLKLSLDAVTGFSMAPLRLATFLGLGGGVLAVLLALYAIVAGVSGHTVAGWTSTVLIVVLGRRRAAALPRPARRVRRPDVHPDAGPPDLLHRLRLADRDQGPARPDRHPAAAGRAARRGHPPPVAQTPDSRYAPTRTSRCRPRPSRGARRGAGAPAAREPVEPVTAAGARRAPGPSAMPASAARVRRDQEAHAGQPLDR